jgi:hypothetical protein
MPYDTDHSAPRRALGRVTSTASTLISYAVFVIGVAALVSFFAPHVGAAGLAWHEGVLPTIAAPTEQDTVVDVGPLLVGVVLSSLGVWLR